jgi:hypothetical protein
MRFAIVADSPHRRQMMYLPAVSLVRIQARADCVAWIIFSGNQYY